MKIRATAACVVLALTSAPAAHADPDVFINSATYAGSGCPAGSVSASPASEWKALVLRFDQFVVSVGPGIKSTEKRKNCSVSVALQLPRKAMHVAVRKVQYAGYADLEANVTATLTSTIYTPRTAERKTVCTATMAGPVQDSYRLTDEVAEPVFSTNPGNTVMLVINSSAQVNNDKDAKAAGALTTDVVDQKTTIVLDLLWRD